MKWLIKCDLIRVTGGVKAVEVRRLLGVLGGQFGDVARLWSGISFGLNGQIPVAH